MLALLVAGCSGSVGTTGDAGTDSTTDVAMDTLTDPAVETAVDSSDATPPACEAMDARATGDCAAIVPGVTWTGEACMHLGSGCGCGGVDCDDVFETVAECVEAKRGCYEASCKAMPVADDMCVDCFAEMFLGTFWTGMECFDLWGCDCMGDGCGRAFTSMEECEAVQQACPAPLCIGTGGTWYPAAGCGPCGHYECGIAPMDACCDEGCDCGPGRSFDPSSGCVDDPGCTAQQSCQATGGTWHPIEECMCEYVCGEQILCSDCMEACDCGTFRVFDERDGCLFDSERCGEADSVALCQGTGGRWAVGEGCGDFACGIPNLIDPCVMPGCDCGRWKNFQTGVGCVPDPLCVMPGEGDACQGSGAYGNCRPGLVCCDGCGMPPGCPMCEQPCCGDAPWCEAGGCPLPPP